MTIADRMLKFQKNNDFEDIVLMFLNEVKKEEILSTINSNVYKAIWILNDDSTVILNGEKFYKED